MSSPWQDEEKLRKAYREVGTQQEVADKFGCSEATICKYMSRFEIEAVHPSGTESKQWIKRVEVLCDYCGSKITREKREVESEKNIFCNQECFAGWKSENWVGESHPRWNHKSVNCTICNLEFEVHGYRDADNYFCTQECRGKWISNTNVGESHPRWKDGNGKFYGTDWEDYKRKVRDRDGDECQKCGLDDGERTPDVHHIEPVRSFEDPNDAHSLDNLIQLCRSCHHKIEKYQPDKQRTILSLN